MIGLYATIQNIKRNRILYIQKESKKDKKK